MSASVYDLLVLAFREKKKIHILSEQMLYCLSGVGDCNVLCSLDSSDLESQEELWHFDGQISTKRSLSSLSSDIYG